MAYQEPFHSFTASIVAAVLAGIMQASVIVVLAFRLRPAQYVAYFSLSSLTGGLLTVLMVKQFHMDVFIAGVIGAFSGAAPAILIPLVVTWLSFKRLGINNSDLTQIYDMVENMQDGKHNPSTIKVEAKPSDTPSEKPTEALPLPKAEDSSPTSGGDV